jgi:hypothetical protein
LGLRNIAKSISQVLSKSPYAIRVPDGWELTEAGEKRVRSLAGVEGRVVEETAVELRRHIQTISHPETVVFLEEAVSCFEHQNYRAAVVLTWVGAVALLYNYVVENNLAEFNVEAQRRDSRWKQAKSADDLARMKEYDFLQVLSAISVIGKNVKEELESALKLRNACGHPNSLKVAESRVASHIEVLTLNVYKPIG